MKTNQRIIPASPSLNPIEIGLSFKSNSTARFATLSDRYFNTHV